MATKEEAKVVSLLRAGKTKPQIAETLGVSVYRVYKIADNAGIEHKHLSDEHRAKISATFAAKKEASKPQRRAAKK